MISQDFLDILRCPVNPQYPLAQEREHLVCTHCGLRFPIKDGFPKLLVEEAEFPPGITAVDQLSCQRERAATAR